ncbi:NAD(P)H-binding protein [Aquimarina sp. W85]|uniref:NAD(P)H-binding protein n=1 Tax=Aquimarina rhodophyticola TaxID=3342246 RepID=UPI00366B0A98
MNKGISILGAGWLGLPLAEKLIAKGYSIKGSTTSDAKLERLQSKGLAAYTIVLTETAVIGNIAQFLKDSKILIIAIPPGLRRNPSSDFVGKIKRLLPYIEASSINSVLFISSTTVYEDTKEIPLITNLTLPNATSIAGKQLTVIEKLLQQRTDFSTTILRFGGLIGKDRHPATMLSGRENIQNPEAPVNLIDREDCIQIILKIINNNAWNKVYNASASNHPKKSEYYTAQCLKRGLDVPKYDYMSVSKGKSIDSKYIQKDLGYEIKDI